MGSRFTHFIQVQPGIPDSALESGHQGFRSGLRGAVGQGREGGIHNVHPRHSRHEIYHVAGAGGVVGMQVDGDRYRLLEAFHQRIGRRGQQQVCHILDADDVGSHLLQLPGQFYEVFLVMDGGDGVGQGSLYHAAVLLGGSDGLLQVAHVVECIEDPDDVDAVLNAFGAEGVHHVVGVVFVAQDVLAPEEHLQLRVGKSPAQLPQPIPGILL